MSKESKAMSLRVDRRTVMAALGSTMVLPTLPNFAFAEGTGLVDAHCHAWSSDLSSYPMAEGRSKDDLKPTDVSSEGLLKREKPLGIEKIVLVQHIWYHGFDSSYLTDSAKQHPGQFAVVGAVGETNEAGPDLMLEKKAEGVKGFRVRGFGTVDWVDSPIMNKMYSVAEAENLVICPLIRNNEKMDNDALLHLAKLSAKHPGTKVSIDHMATVQPGDEEQLKRLLSLAQHPNVYVKISGFNKFDVPPYDKVKDQIAKLIEAYGVERLMWGSDLPVLEYNEPNNLKSAFDLVDSGLGLSDAEKAFLMRNTATQVFF